MKVAQIVTEAPRIEPGFDINKAMSSIDVGKEPTISSKKSTNTGTGPLKGQSMKHRGVVYQWKGANWIVIDNSEWKQKNPRNRKSFRIGSIAPADTSTVLTNKATKVNAGPGGKSNTSSNTDTKTTTKSNPTDSGKISATKSDKTDYEKDMDKSKKNKVDDLIDPKKDMGLLKKIWKNKATKIILGTIKGFLGGWAGKIAITAWDVSGVVGAHNEYFDVLQKQYDDKKSGAPVRTLMENGNKLKYIREEKIVKPMVDLTFGSIGMFIAAGGLGMAAGGLVAGFFTGGIGWILTLLAGAAAAYGGYEGGIMIAKELGWYEALYTRWMNPENGYLTSKYLAREYEEFGDLTFWTTLMAISRVNPAVNPLQAPLIDPRDVGGVVKDKIDAIIKEETVISANSSKDQVIDMLKSDKKLAKLFQKGKQELKKQRKQEARREAT